MTRCTPLAAACSMNSSVRRTFRSFWPTTGSICTQAIFTTASSRVLGSLMRPLHVRHSSTESIAHSGPPGQGLPRYTPRDRWYRPPATSSCSSCCYVAIVTLALPVVFTQVILSGGAYTGSSSGLPIPVPALSIMQWYWISGGLLVLVAAVSYVFVSSDTGRILVAIRENEERCRYLGLRTSRLKIRLMAVCSAVAALAGSGYVLFGSVAAHSYGDFVFGTELVVWTALGGRGTLAGPILGTVGVDYVSAVLGGNLPFVWLLFVGFAFVLIVVYLPQGLVPAIGRTLSRVTRASRSPLSGRGVVAGAEAVRAAKPQVLATTGEETGTPVLELRNVSKRYGSLQVLDRVSLQARRGEVVGIVGPNGAGKTTLLRCIADGREQSSGDILVNGRHIAGLPPQECVALGVSRKFQTPNVFDALSVLDCLRVARSSRACRSP